MKTRGAPPGPPPNTRSAYPSPVTSPAATNDPLRRFWASAPGKAKKSATSRAGAPARTDWPVKTAVRGPPPNPAATTTSGAPSAFTSPSATRAPPRKFGSSIPRKLARAAVLPSGLRPNTLTRGPPPWSGVTTNSARPSPSRSAAATYPPPRKSPPNGSNGATNRVLLSAPLTTATRIGTPGPVTRTVSGTPSPFTSPVAPRVTAGTVPNGERAAAGLSANWPVEMSGVNTSPRPSGVPPTVSEPARETVRPGENSEVSSVAVARTTVLTARGATAKVNAAAPPASVVTSNSPTRTRSVNAPAGNSAYNWILYGLSGRLLSVPVTRVAVSSVTADSMTGWFSSRFGPTRVMPLAVTPSRPRSIGGPDPPR